MAKRILLVEKEKKLAQFIGLELQKEGYRADLFETGKDALASARANQYDLFLLNFMLDDMTGTEFAAQLSVIKPASVILYWIIVIIFFNILRKSNALLLLTW